MPLKTTRKRIKISGRRTGTLTADGYIPYKRYRGINCPVALNPPWQRFKSSYSLFWMPKRDHAGRLVYVLPGGEQVMFEG